MHDGLTDTFNRGYLEVAIDRTVKDVRRNGGEASILFVDVDGMKDVNDTYGHQAGDRLLVDLARLLRDSCRESDVVARYGGDEFVVLMPGTGAAGAAEVERKVEAAIAARNVGAGQAPQLVGQHGDSHGRRPKASTPCCGRPTAACTRPSARGSAVARGTGRPRTRTGDRRPQPAGGGRAARPEAKVCPAQSPAGPRACRRRRRAGTLARPTKGCTIPCHRAPQQSADVTPILSREALAASSETGLENSTWIDGAFTAFRKSGPGLSFSILMGEPQLSAVVEDQEALAELKSHAEVKGESSSRDESRRVAVRRRALLRRRRRAGVDARRRRQGRQRRGRRVVDDGGGRPAGRLRRPGVPLP